MQLKGDYVEFRHKPVKYMGYIYTVTVSYTDFDGCDYQESTFYITTPELFSDEERDRIFVYYGIQYVEGFARTYSPFTVKFVSASVSCYVPVDIVR